MSIKKTSYYKAKEASIELEPVEPNEPEMEDAEGDCCVCDNPGSSQCVAEASSFGKIYTTAAAQLFAYWLGR